MILNLSFFYIRSQKELGFPVKLILWVGRFLINGNSVVFAVYENPRFGVQFRRLLGKIVYILAMRSTFTVGTAFVRY